MQISKAVELAEKELETKKIDKIKEIVKQTLEKIDDLTDKKKGIEKEIKILKMDIDDLKSGRLDKIQERQKIDEDARKMSLITVRPRDTTIGTSMVPRWRIMWDIIPSNTSNTWTYLWDKNSTSFTVGSSDVRIWTTGAYKLTSGRIKYL